MSPPCIACQSVQVILPWASQYSSISGDAQERAVASFTDQRSREVRPASRASRLSMCPLVAASAARYSVSR